MLRKTTVALHLLATLALVCGCGQQSAAATQDLSLIVSMYRVIANPHAYEGKRIVVHGYLRLHPESGTLFLNETAMRHGLEVDSLYLRLTHAQLTSYKSISGAWVFVEGTFSAPQSEENLTFAGMLSGITRIKRMDIDER